MELITDPKNYKLRPACYIILEVNKSFTVALYFSLGLVINYLHDFIWELGLGKVLNICHVEVCADVCQNLCKFTAGCNFFSFHSTSNECVLMQEDQLTGYIASCSLVSGLGLAKLSLN